MLARSLVRAVASQAWVRLGRSVVGTCHARPLRRAGEHPTLRPRPPSLPHPAPNPLNAAGSRRVHCMRRHPGLLRLGHLGRRGEPPAQDRGRSLRAKPHVVPRHLRALRISPAQIQVRCRACTVELRCCAYTRRLPASRYISKAEILNIPVIGWAMRFAKHIAIRRTDRASQLATFKARPRLISA